MKPGGRYRPHGGHRRGRDGRRGRRGWACRGRRRGRCGRRGSGGCPGSRGDRGAGEGFQRYEARQQGEVQEQQFQRGGRLKAGEHLPLAFEHHLPRGMDIRGIELRREVQQALLFRVRHVERGGGRGPGLADEEQVTPQRGQFAEEKAEIHATLQQFLRQRGNGEAVLSLECVEKALIKLLSGKAEHAAGGGFGQVVAAEGQRLAEPGTCCRARFRRHGAQGGGRRFPRTGCLPC